ncbi:MAG: META domain-containing protein [Methanomicrobiales archaeon]|nr:META domain-containing protein [Methanomicrobiales archaeon]
MLISHIPIAPLPLTGITIESDTNGCFGGYGSCNRYTGTWQVDGRCVSISEVKSEGLSGPDHPRVMKQKEQNFAILQNSTGYGTNREDMALSYGSGKDRLTFKQVLIDSLDIVQLSAQPKDCISRSSTGSTFGPEKRA